MLIDVKLIPSFAIERTLTVPITLAPGLVVDVDIFTQPEYAATITTSFVKDVEIDLQKSVDLELD